MPQRQGCSVEGVHTCSCAKHKRRSHEKDRALMPGDRATMGLVCRVDVLSPWASCLYAADRSGFGPPSFGVDT